MVHWSRSTEALLAVGFHRAAVFVRVVAIPQAPATALFVVGVCHLVYGEQGLLQSFTWVFAVAVMLFYCFCLHYGVNCAQDWAAFFLSFSFCLLFVGPLSLTVLAYLCKPVCAKSRPPGLGVAIVGW
eukprot:4287802-Amphidinium_carterae.1